MGILNMYETVPRFERRYPESNSHESYLPYHLQQQIGDSRDTQAVNRDKGFGSSQTTRQVGLIEQEGTPARAIIISAGRGSDFVPRPHTSSNSDGGYRVHLVQVHIHQGNTHIPRQS